MPEKISAAEIDQSAPRSKIAGVRQWVAENLRPGEAVRLSEVAEETGVNSEYIRRCIPKDLVGPVELRRGMYAGEVDSWIVHTGPVENHGKARKQRKG